METQKCGLCDELMLDGVYCTVCNKDLHFHCAGVTEAGYRRLGDSRRLSFRCSKCKLIGTAHAPNSPRPESQSTILLEIQALSEKLNSFADIKDEITALRTEFIDFTSSLNAQFNDIVKDFSSKIHVVEQRVEELERVQVQTVELQARVEKLEEESDNRDQWSRLNNVEIKGIPQLNNENLFDLVTRIGEKINYPIAKTQINFLSRVPTREKENIKPIIVNFCNRYVKEDFIAAARYKSKTSPISCSQIGFTSNQRVFINDHLTPKNKMLLSKTKKAAREMVFQYVWVKQAKIYVRKSDTSPVIQVKSEKDLAKIV